MAGRSSSRSEASIRSGDGALGDLTRAAVPGYLLFGKRRRPLGLAIQRLFELLLIVCENLGLIAGARKRDIGQRPIRKRTRTRVGCVDLNKHAVHSQALGRMAGHCIGVIDMRHIGEIPIQLPARAIQLNGNSSVAFERGNCSRFPVRDAPVIPRRGELNLFSNSKRAFGRLIDLNTEGSAWIVGDGPAGVMKLYRERVALSLDSCHGYIIAARGAGGLVIPMESNHVTDPVGCRELSILAGEILPRL